jgi:hypothetical protein
VVADGKEDLRLGVFTSALKIGLGSLGNLLSFVCPAMCSSCSMVISLRDMYERQVRAISPWPFVNNFSLSYCNLRYLCNDLWTRRTVDVS